MWLTELYPMTNFQSFCVIAAQPAYRTLKHARIARRLAQCRAPSGNSGNASRMMPYAPSFFSTPACIIEAAVGAAAYPSGDHV